MSLSRAGVMSCDEEQVCLMIKQVQVKAISDGGYGPFSNTYQVFSKLFRHYRRKLRAVVLGKGHCNNWVPIIVANMK